MLGHVLRSSARSKALFTPPERDRDAEAARQRRKELAKLVASSEPTRQLSWTSAPRGQHTPLFLEYSAKTIRSVTPKTVWWQNQPSATSQKAAHAALCRWYKSSAGNAVGSPERRLAKPVPSLDAVRYWRRGESRVQSANYRGYDEADLAFWARALEAKQIKWTEYATLYKEGRVAVPKSTIAEVIARGAIEEVESKGLPALGAPRRVLTADQEDFGLGLVVLFDDKNRPLSKDELMRWAAQTAERNGTRSCEDDLRSWYEHFRRRCLKEHQVDIKNPKTEQVSAQRAAVNISGMRSFQDKVNNLLGQHPEVARRGLKATGDWDETKLDLNAPVA